jgi:hypothetical protein
MDDKNDIDNIIKLINCLEGNNQNNEKKIIKMELI